MFVHQGRWVLAIERYFFTTCLVAVAAGCNAVARPVEGAAQGQGQVPLLSRPVASFRIDGLTVIDGVMQFVRSEHIPLAIEYANPDDLAKPVTVNLSPTTVGQAFAALLPRDRGYAVHLQDGVVHLVNCALSSKRHTLLDEVLPEFSAAPDHGNPLTVVMASNLLRIELGNLLGPKAPSRTSGPAGIVASLGGGLMQNHIGPLKVRNNTVRQILDRLISEHDNAAWAIVVPPSQLKRLPVHGPFSFGSVNDLWVILEYDVSPRRWSDGLLGALRNNWGSR